MEVGGRQHFSTDYKSIFDSLDNGWNDVSRSGDMQNIFNIVSITEMRKPPQVSKLKLMEEVASYTRKFIVVKVYQNPYSSLADDAAW